MQIGSSPNPAPLTARASAASPSRSNGLESLTEEDRALIKATTGYEVTANSELAPGIAFEIASERRMGLVTQSIDGDYLNRLAAKYSDAGPADRPFSTSWIAAATAYLEGPWGTPDGTKLEVTT